MLTSLVSTDSPLLEDDGKDDGKEDCKNAEIYVDSTCEFCESPATKEDLLFYCTICENAGEFGVYCQDCGNIKHKNKQHDFKNEFYKALVEYIEAKTDNERKFARIRIQQLLVKIIKDSKVLDGISTGVITSVDAITTGAHMAADPSTYQGISAANAFATLPLIHIPVAAFTIPIVLGLEWYYFGKQWWRGNITKQELYFRLTKSVVRSGSGLASGFGIVTSGAIVAV